jgi:hypothetical protein
MQRNFNLIAIGKHMLRISSSLAHCADGFTVAGKGGCNTSGCFSTERQVAAALGQQWQTSTTLVADV